MPGSECLTQRSITEIGYQAEIWGQNAGQFIFSEVNQNGIILEYKIKIQDFPVPEGRMSSYKIDFVYIQNFIPSEIMSGEGGKEETNAPDWYKDSTTGRIIWFAREDDSFTKNGTEWKNVGKDDTQVISYLGLQKIYNFDPFNGTNWVRISAGTSNSLSGTKTYNIIEGTSVKGASLRLYVPVMVTTEVSVLTSLVSKNSGPYGFERVDGKSEVTGINLTMLVTAKTNGLFELGDLGGEFGVGRKYTSLGVGNLFSGKFKHSGPAIGNSFYAYSSGYSTLDISLFNYSQMRYGRGLYMNINSSLNFYNRVNGSRGQFNISKEWLIKTK